MDDLTYDLFTATFHQIATRPDFVFFKAWEGLPNEETIRMRLHYKSTIGPIHCAHFQYDKETIQPFLEYLGVNGINTHSYIGEPYVETFYQEYITESRKRIIDEILADLD